MNERTRTQLDRLTPEKRAKAEAAIERFRTPEARSRELIDRDEIDREYRETGTIATTGETTTVDELIALRRFVGKLRAEREARGLSLDDVSRRSGLERSAISKLEVGHNVNPTVKTLARYARAIGVAITWNFEQADIGA